MPHKPAKLLQDILDAGRGIQSFVAGRTIDDYNNQLMLRSAVERQFEIIGEALNRLRHLDPVLVERLGPYQKIIAFRNIIAHGYEVLDAAIVWQVIHDYLPALLEQSRQLLSDVEA